MSEILLLLLLLLLLLYYYYAWLHYKYLCMLLYENLSSRVVLTRQQTAI